MVKKSPYQILGLEGDFEQNDIKKAYRKMIKLYPPEQNPQEFAKIRDAYDVLSGEHYFLKLARYTHYGFYDLEYEEEPKSEHERVDVEKFLKTIFEIPFEIKEVK